ncbi:proline-rich protein 2-like, partial [Oenanthe melanoleuca]|uniref:proline-rich protein 2-like n=1 Tax=Oenanthe melanoleuca TaxID=2939378 RepID=UPI0024C14D1B
SRIPLVRTSSKPAARRRPRRGAGPGTPPGDPPPREPRGRRRPRPRRAAGPPRRAGPRPRRRPPLGRRPRQGGGRAEGGASGARRSWGDPREGPGARPESPPRARARAPRRPGGPRGAHSPARGASSSRGARPAPLRAPARPTQPLEPILIPKLRIRLADFPYLHCSNMPEAVHLGDLLRIWVRPGARLTPSPPDFHGPARAHRTPPEPRRFPRRGPLSRGEPIPGRPALHKEKRTLPGAPAGFSGIGCVTALGASRRPSPPLRIRGSEPDSLSIG